MPSAADNLHPVWDRFTPEERQRLLDEDTAALSAVAGILLAIVTAGFLAGALAVMLMA